MNHPIRIWSSVNLTYLSLFFIVLIIGCQEQPFEKPPIHLNPNMDTQNRYNPQSSSEFFADGMSMRMPVPGTVAVDDLRNDDEYFYGTDDEGNFITTIPLPITTELLYRGQERFDIFCSPCHSRIGDGNGIIMQYKYPIPPPSFHTDKVRQMSDGYIFSVISNGVRNMPSYKHQIPVQDRWAIVSYVRALQLSRNARESDIPENQLTGLSK
ncbi:MAG: c-type cytochrome [Fidelibacterota bacterium]